MALITSILYVDNGKGQKILGFESSDEESEQAPSTSDDNSVDSDNDVQYRRKNTKHHRRNESYTIFYCSECPMTFASHKELENHLEAHRIASAGNVTDTASTSAKDGNKDNSDESTLLISDENKLDWKTYIMSSDVWLNSGGSTIPQTTSEIRQRIHAVKQIIVRRNLKRMHAKKVEHKCLICGCTFDRVMLMLRHVRVDHAAKQPDPEDRAECSNTSTGNVPRFKVRIVAGRKAPASRRGKCATAPTSFVRKRN